MTGFMKTVSMKKSGMVYEMTYSHFDFTTPRVYFSVEETLERAEMSLTQMYLLYTVVFVTAFDVVIIIVIVVFVFLAIVGVFVVVSVVVIVVYYLS